MNMIEALAVAHAKPGELYARPVSWKGYYRGYFYPPQTPNKPRLKSSRSNNVYCNANIPEFPCLLEEWEVVDKDVFLKERTARKWGWKLCR